MRWIFLCFVLVGCTEMSKETILSKCQSVCNGEPKCFVECSERLLKNLCEKGDKP